MPRRPEVAGERLGALVPTRSGGYRPPGYPLEKVPAGAGGPGPSPAERPRVAPLPVVLNIEPPSLADLGILSAVRFQNPAYDSLARRPDRLTS